jgi:hypothetical protein
MAFLSLRMQLLASPFGILELRDFGTDLETLKSASSECVSYNAQLLLRA